MLRRRLATGRIAISTLAAAGVALLVGGGASTGAAPAAVATGSASTAVPIVRITFGPAGRTNLTNPTFGYESNYLEARIECRVDSAPFASCGPVEEKAVGNGPEGRLTEGPHTFEVRAVDAAGVTGPAARVAFTVDAEPPIAEFLAGPFGVTHQTRPKFRIRIAGATSFSCRVTGRDVRIKVRHCDGPHSFRVPRPLPEGEYEVWVRASDRAGNETENSGTFTVRTEPGQPPGPYHGSTEYIGGGDGIKVLFRVRRHKLIQARISGALDCLTSGGGERRRHRGHYDLSRANPHLPIALDRRGRFREEYPPKGQPLDEEGEAVELLTGRVGPRFLTGEYSLHYGGYFGSGARERHQICQTGAFPTARSRPVTFHARRVRAG
jgi:Bacterial Ig-like domain